MISEAEARERILNRVEALPPTEVSLERAFGRFLAKDVNAVLPLPLFDNSAMDGYAVIASDCAMGGRLHVVGEQPAGVDRGLSVKSGQAVRIFTGAPVPRGADAVVMQEDVERNGTDIVIKTEVEPGEFVRRRGCDLGQGQKILSAGDRLDAASIALLAAQGVTEVGTGGQVRMAIVSTGDEVIQPGAKLEPGQLFESNSVLLRHLAERIGVTVALTQHARDEAEELRAALSAGLEQDVLIITGGVSVGDRDLVRPILQDLEVAIDLWRVAIKPGKPFLFGRRGTCAIFALPGNPVSAFVTFLVLVRPALLKMMGANEAAMRWPETLASLSCEVENGGDRPHYLRGQLKDGVFTPIGRQESHALYGLSRSNALLLVVPGEKIKAGATVRLHSWAQT